MAISSLRLFISLILSIAVSNALDSSDDYRSPSSCSDQFFLRELEGAKLKIARLESILEERLGEIIARTEYFRDSEKKIEDLTTEVDRLKTMLSDFGHDYSRANVKRSALEKEVQLLWAAARKNNFEIHALEQKALDAERRLKEVTSQVEDTAEIVTEQWIQIQQLEQAVYMAEVRASKMRKELWNRCPFLKFFMTLYEDFLKTLKGILDPFVQRDGSTLAFCKARALQAFAAVNRYHHQGVDPLAPSISLPGPPVLRETIDHWSIFKKSCLPKLLYEEEKLDYKLQGSLRQAMKSNEFTAVLAHEELVFFVASALVAFPTMTACILLLSQFS